MYCHEGYIETRYPLPMPLLDEILKNFEEEMHDLADDRLHISEGFDVVGHKDDNEEYEFVEGKIGWEFNAEHDRTRDVKCAIDKQLFIIQENTSDTCYEHD